MKSIFITVVMVAVVAFAIYMAMHYTMQDNRRETCASARVVVTGGGHYLCISPDGRIIGNG